MIRLSTDIDWSEPHLFTTSVIAPRGHDRFGSEINS